MIKAFQSIAAYYVKDMKFKNKLLISHLLLVLLPTIIIAVFFYNQFYELVVTSTITAEQTVALKGGDPLEAMLTQVEYAANAVRNSPLTEEMFGGKRGKKSVANEEELRNYYQFIFSMVDNDMITDIRVYYDEKAYDSLKYANFLGNPIFKSIENITSTYWYGIFSTGNAETLYCPSLYLSHSEVRDNGELAYIFRIPYTDAYEETSAFIAIYFSEEKIADTLKNNVVLNKGASYIVNDRSVLVSTSDNALSGVYFMTQGELESEIGRENIFVTDTFVGENVYIGYQAIKSSGWHLVSALPVNDVVQKGRDLIIQFILIYVFLVIAAFFMTLLLSRSIEKRLNTIVAQMKRVRFGKPESIQQSQVTKDEIGNVADTYNYMTGAINQLLEEQKRTAKEMQLSEFKALQSQINPHFLYNSLEMISWLVEGERKEEAVQALRVLSRFYKIALSNKDAVGTIQIELAHVSLYVKIQNMRYQDAVDFLIDIPTDILQCQIPRLTFQPIVENAIQHGTSLRKEKKGTIVITGWQEANDVVVLISDDGVGMDKKRIKMLLDGKGISEKGSNIGVYNTHRRLQLLYGNNYGLRYASEVGKGTEVEVRIPMYVKE